MESSILNAVTNAYSIFSESYKYHRRAKKEIHLITSLKNQWANRILGILNTELKIIGEPTSEKSTLFVGNHISYLDIPLLMASVPNITFVAKQELQKWPIFGQAAASIDTVFVRRESKSSRSQARQAIEEALLNGKKIALFPSGTTCTHESKVWRRGAFEIAKKLDIWIQPFRISYTPLRKVAYIDDDFFPTHLVQVARLPKIIATIEFSRPIKISSPDSDRIQLYYWSRGLIDCQQNNDLQG